MIRHRTTDPLCIRHREPRTWWQRRAYDRGRGFSCKPCEWAREYASFYKPYRHDYLRDRWTEPDTGVTIDAEDMPPEPIPPR